jgi:hypothetical protein
MAVVYFVVYQLIVNVDELRKNMLNLLQNYRSPGRVLNAIGLPAYRSSIPRRCKGFLL